MGKVNSKIKGWKRNQGPVSCIACALLASSLVLSACATTPIPLPPTSTPASTPRPGPDMMQPPPGLWRDAVPPEALQTLRALKTANTPQRDLIDVTLRLNHSVQSIPQVEHDQP